MPKWILYGIIGLGIVAVLLFGYQTCQATRWHDKYNKLEGKAQAAGERFEETMDTAEKQIKKLAKSLNEEVKIRKKADKKIETLEATKNRLVRNLKKEKAKTASMTPDELMRELVIEIGSEVRLTGSGHFEFTRKGAEFTLHQFKEGDFNLERYNRQLAITEELEAKIASYDKSISDLEKLNLNGKTALAACEDALKASEKSKEALKKTFKAGRWKNFATGAGAITAMVVILKLTKVF